MSKTVYVLLKYKDEEIVGIVDSEEKAMAWRNADITNRVFTAFVLNEIPCEECKEDECEEE